MGTRFAHRTKADTAYKNSLANKQDKDEETKRKISKEHGKRFKMEKRKLRVQRK